ncbi:MAG: ATP-grasp domain-containing protein [Selenomonadaceae bacterium]|nr:ATP-grasp domain-containing protein [Selenomonadaceae bacterium]
MEERIAVLGANEPLIPFYRRAKALGYHVIGIAVEEGAVCKEYCDVFYPVSFADKDAVVEICRNEKVDGILSFSLESALPTVTYVAGKLGLVSNSEESIRLTQSKFAQRQALEKAGIPVPKYYLIDKATDLDKVRCRFPVIVKPVDSGGSQGICKVEAKERLLEAYSYAIRYSRTSRAIVEEFVDGREFSVEYISHHGKHYFLQITDKVTSGPPRFVEKQHHQPADIPPDVWTRIRKMVEENLTALKIENSASHTEIKWNSNDELFIIETGARMGGDFISSDLVRLSTGYDFVDGAIQLAVNKFKKPVFSQSMHSGVYFYSKLAPEVGDIIKHHEKWPEIVEWEYSEEPLMEVRSNADRRGYLLYQSSKGKLVL